MPRFLARAGEVLGRSLDLDTTLGDVASIAVPERADWCIIDLLDGGTIRRVAIAHDDPDKVGLRADAHRALPAVARGRRRTVRRAPRWPAGADRRHRRHDAERRRARRRASRAPARPGLRRQRSSRRSARAGASSGRSPSRSANGARVRSTSTWRPTSPAAHRRRSTTRSLFRERSEIARTLQRSLLPPRLPRIEGFEVAARYRAAGSGIDVGGDFYDVFPAQRH